MAISYKNLWITLAKKEISPTDLKNKVGLGPNTMAKFRKNQPVTLNVIDRICEVLDCEIKDVVRRTDKKGTQDGN